jgi:polyphosphate glucokinase
MQVLGIDIGGSATKGAIVDTETGLLVSERVRIAYKTIQEPAAIVKSINKIRKQLNYVGPIGAGFPGVVKHGQIFTSANLHKDWIGKNLASMVTEKTGMPAVILNDADAAGLAEMRFGDEALKQYDVVMFLTIGTGLGTAIFVEGKLMPNTELGHIDIRGKEAEHRASAAIKTKEKLSWKQWASRLNNVLLTYEALLNPEIFVLGGGISSDFAKYSKYLMTESPVVAAKLQNLAGIVGAAMAAHEKYPEG